LPKNEIQKKKSEFGGFQLQEVRIKNCQILILGFQCVAKVYNDNQSFFTSHLDDNHFGYKQKFQRNERAAKSGDISPHKKSFQQEWLG
jgi:hypothetical protein